MTDTTLTFLLTERRRFAAQDIDAAIAKALGQADRLPTLHPGAQAQLERHVSILPRNGWPFAALTRQYDAKDAEISSWLRADPAHVRAEMGVVRLLACGDLGLTRAEADRLVKPLKVLFGDTGFPLSAPDPARWYLMLPKDIKLPKFQLPDEAIGADIFSHMPADDLTKRWRALLNEAQITLHNHPLNAERIQKGLLPVNSLYFWGGGSLPDQVKFHADHVISDDVILNSLKLHAGIDGDTAATGSVLHDARQYRDWPAFEREHLLPAMDGLNDKKHDAVILDFADGSIFEIRTKQKWRFWRGLLRDFA